MRINSFYFKKLLNTEEVTYSDEALEAIFDALEETPNIEFDPIGIRCQWTEYSTEELLTDYGYLLEEDEEEEETEETEETEEKIINVLREKTFIKKLKNGNFLVEDF